MRILIALDESPQSIETDRQAASRPWPAKSQFVLLHVLDPYPFSKMPISLQRVQEDMARQLRELGAPLRKAGWQTGTEVLLGRAPQLIAMVARSWKADFVIVGSTGESALMRVLLGSTARSVLRQARCSVEIVRKSNKKNNPAGRGMRVLIATDGSDFSLAALRSVAKRPWPAGSIFRVIAIPEPFMPLDQFQQFELKEIENLNTQALKDAKKYYAAGAQILQKAGLTVGEGTPLPIDTDTK